KEAYSLSRKIPQDLKVIGFTDGVLSKFARPGLTTVSQHGRELGEQACHLLIKRIENETLDLPYQTVVVTTELIEREST
ncbi:MAG: substrate-binding domain-containing protein, partial [Bacteroidota bacterium]